MNDIINELGLEDLPGEIWKDIMSYPGYQASSLGRIKSLGRVVQSNNQVTTFKIIIKEKILKYYVANKWGYCRTQLHIEGKIYTRTVHTLVMEAFIGPRPPKITINHIDGNKRNNSILNLEYSTQGDNARHAFKIGLKLAMKGEKHPGAKLDEIKVSEIRALKGKLTQREIAKMYNVTRPNITAIFANKTWKQT